MKMQAINKFEFLPNEIFFECFDYLKWTEIYHSFERLNYRFSNIIQNIPLHLNFRKTPEVLFDRFCRKISSNPEIIKQIYSLHLSNKNTYWQISLFLSTFPLNEFSHLQSLTLTGVSKGDLPKLKSMLPLVSRLSSFYLIDSVLGTDEIFSSLPKSQLRILKMSHVPDDLKYLYKLSSITHLTISDVHLSLLYQLLNDIPTLKYLNARDIKMYRPNSLKKETYTIARYARNLKKLIYKGNMIEFRVIKMLLMETPQLRSLTIDANSNDSDMMDACVWKDLIITSLPYLNIFKFKFECTLDNESNFIEGKLKEFQSDFWCKQHHWPTEYSLSIYSYIIYTIPYISNTYMLIPCINKYCNQLINNSKKFGNVTKLTIDSNEVKEKSQYYFSSINRMKLENSWTVELIKSLAMMVNLTNVEHLIISYRCRLQTPSVLLELLKQTRKLFSMTLNQYILVSLFGDNELCKYLNEMIIKLQIVDDFEHLLNDPHNLKKFCETFSNIKQLGCTTKPLDCLLYLLKHLSKLEYLTLYSSTNDFGFRIYQLEKEAQKLGLQIITNPKIISYTQLSIRIKRN